MGRRVRRGWWAAGTGAAALVLVVALLLADALWPPGMDGAASTAGPPATGPCARLNAGEVAYPAHDAGRVTFATAAAYSESRVRITGCARTARGYVQEWQATGFAGVSGFAPPGKMWEDTGYSPAGSFTFTEALGRADPGTALEYHTINRRSRWGGEHGPTYNQYFEGRGGAADENLWRYLREGHYEQAAVINWNREPDMPTVQGASFAIFFHTGNTVTVGCISTDLDTVTALLRTAVPGDRIIMGVERDVFAAPAASPAATSGPPPAGL